MKLIFENCATGYSPKGLPFSTVVTVPKKSAPLLINGEKVPSTEAWLERTKQVCLALGIANCAYMIVDKNIQPERMHIKFFFEKEAAIPPFLVAVIGNTKGNLHRYFSANNAVESRKQEDDLKKFLGVQGISAGILRTEPHIMMVTTGQRYDDLAIYAHMIEFKSKAAPAPVVRPYSFPVLLEHKKG